MGGASGRGSGRAVSRTLPLNAVFLSHLATILSHFTIHVFQAVGVGCGIGEGSEVLRVVE